MVHLVDAARLPRSPRTAFVLSGGASLGAMQAGMVHALYERGIVPDLLVGTSAGALNAAFLASRRATVATARQLAEIWRELRREGVFPLSARTLIGGLASRRDHLVADRGLRRLAERHLQIERLEQATIPANLVAFDVLAGEEVCLSDGPVTEAVLAASAIPGVLPPVYRGDQVLVDGGVVNNTPISHAVALGAERIDVLPTHGLSRGLAAPPRGALDALHAFSLLVGGRLEADLRRYASEVELHLLPAENRHAVRPTDFDHADRLIAEGLRAAREALASAPAVEALAA
jgi:NTE family protein